jgi:threonine dehydrogenase-like Zn-dependent dehydrogenase
MQTVVLEQPGRLALTDTAPPEGQLAPDEALVRVQRVGICGSDLKAFKGEMPFLSYPRILGHELGVELLDIGANDQGLQVGDRAAVEPYLNCGRCIACRRGRTNCKHGGIG